MCCSQATDAELLGFGEGDDDEEESEEEEGSEDEDSDEDDAAATAAAKGGQDAGWQGVLSVEVWSGGTDCARANRSQACILYSCCLASRLNTIVHCAMPCCVMLCLVDTGKAKKQQEKQKASKKAAAAEADDSEQEEEEAGSDDEQQQEEGEEGEEGGRKTIQVTSSLVDSWTQSALDNASLGAMMQLVKAYR